jgi:hypothetical protein
MTVLFLNKFSKFHKDLSNNTKSSVTNKTLKTKEENRGDSFVSIFNKMSYQSYHLEFIGIL